jgi:hypothetical protein
MAKKSNITVKFDFIESDGNVFKIVITPSNATGEKIVVSRGERPKSAVNAAVDYLHFRERGGFRHLEPGLHLRFNPNKPPSYLEDAGYIRTDYEGGKIAVNYGKVRNGKWGVVLVDHGSVGMADVEYGQRLSKDAFMHVRRVEWKHDALDDLLSGITIVAVVGKFGEWGNMVRDTVEAEDLDAAYAAYQEKKGTAALKETAYYGGVEIVRDVQANHRTTKQKQEALVAAAHETKISVVSSMDKNEATKTKTPITEVHGQVVLLSRGFKPKGTVDWDKLTVGQKLWYAEKRYRIYAG